MLKKAKLTYYINLNKTIIFSNIASSYPNNILNKASTSQKKQRHNLIIIDKKIISAINNKIEISYTIKNYSKKEIKNYILTDYLIPNYYISHILFKNVSFDQLVYINDSFFSFPDGVLNKLNIPKATCYSEKKQTIIPSKTNIKIIFKKINT